jgi:hypothetical protein
MLEKMLEWREKFLALIASKRYTVNATFVRYVGNTVPTDDTEAEAMYAVCAKYMLPYESANVTSSGVEGTRLGVITLRTLAYDLFGGGPIQVIGAWTIAAGVEGEPQEGKFGFKKDPLDPTGDFGDYDPTSFNGGASAGGYDMIELTANPADGEIYLFVRPAENVPYSVALLTFEGTTIELSRNEESGGFQQFDTGFAALVEAADGTTLPATITFKYQ